jgi:hypothetical protein
MGGEKFDFEKKSRYEARRISRGIVNASGG